METLKMHHVMRVLLDVAQLKLVTKLKKIYPCHHGNVKNVSRHVALLYVAQLKLVTK